MLLHLQDPLDKCGFFLLMQDPLPPFLLFQCPPIQMITKGRLRNPCISSRSCDFGSSVYSSHRSRKLGICPRTCAHSLLAVVYRLCSCSDEWWSDDGPRRCTRSPRPLRRPILVRALQVHGKYRSNSIVGAPACPFSTSPPFSFSTVHVAFSTPLQRRRTSLLCQHTSRSRLSMLYLRTVVLLSIAVTLIWGLGTSSVKNM